MLRGLERYPSTQIAYVGSFGPGGSAPRFVDSRLDASAYASTYGSAIYFNNRHAADPAGYRRQLKREPPIRSQVARDPTGVAVHEFGHQMAHQGDADGVASDITARSAAAAHETPTLHVFSQVSAYGATNDHELAAEAFTDVMLHGSGASSLSSKIVDGLDRAYVAAGGEIGSG